MLSAFKYIEKLLNYHKKRLMLSLIRITIHIFFVSCLLLLTPAQAQQSAVDLKIPDGRTDKPGFENKGQTKTVNPQSFGKELESYRDDLFTIVRLHYKGGGDWYSDPSSLPNLLKFIRENTQIQTSDSEVVLEIISDRLFQYPYLYMTGHGNINFTDEEARRLRTHLTNGGFLHADDNYGMDESFRREIKKVFPDKDIVSLPKDFGIFNSHFSFPQGLPKIHEHDGKPAEALGIFHEDRLVVLYTYQCDLGDGWEDPGVHPEDSADKRDQALKMGLNIVIWALMN